MSVDREGAARERIEIGVGEMTYGASALGRTEEGQVVFVDDALPGERVVAEVGKRKRRYLQARTIEVLQGSPARVSPPCRYVPECGGCQWQHATYEAQVVMKQDVLAETMRRAGVAPLPVEVVAAPAPERYRIRGEFHIIRGGAAGEPAGIRLGFNRRRTYELVAIDDCLIHHRHIADALPGLGRALEAAGAGTARSLRLTCNPDGPELLWQALGGSVPDGLAGAIAAELPGYTVSLDSFSLAYDGTRVDGREGSPLTFRVDSETFVQVNHGMAHRLYGTALDFIGDSPGRVLDGYAGFGALSILAATRSDARQRPESITMIEESRAAVLLARLHLRIHDVGATSLAGRMEDRLKDIEPEEVDTLVVDPPRAGCSTAVLEEVARLGPSRIVYISCDPATLGRDLASLSDDGYSVVRQAFVDMFPHTYHIESVTLLQR